MSMQDFASALGGGGGPPPPSTPPPDQGAPQSATPADDTGVQGGDTYATSLDALDGAESALHSFIQLDPDEGDRAEATKALGIVIKLKASNQDSSNAGDLTSLQRALQGGPGATAGAVGASAGPPPPGGGY